MTLDPRRAPPRSDGAISLWQPSILDRPGPAYRAIRDFIAEAIERGELQAGDRMPSHRALARRLGVALGTVTRAYGEALRQGLLRGEHGRGTFVGELHRRPGMSYPRPPSAEMLDLYKNHPLKVPEIEDEAWCSALLELARRGDLVEQADVAWSVPQDGTRRRGAAWIGGLGFEVAPRHVVDCPGLQAALSSVLATVAKPGDRLATAALTFPVVTAIAERQGLEVHGLELDEHGLSASAFERLCRENPPALLFAEPNVHAPTTAVMPHARRLKLASIAERHGVFILEMDLCGALLESRPPPIAAALPGQSFFIADLSHASTVGLRSAFVAAPPHLASRLTAAASSMAGLTPQLTALIAAWWIENGVVSRLIDARRSELARRQALVTRYFAGSVRGHPAAHHAWLELPESWSSKAFVEAAEAAGVAVTDGDWFRVEGVASPRAVRLCLGNVPALERLESACRRLRGLLDEGPRESGPRRLPRGSPRDASRDSSRHSSKPAGNL